jgi:hypothetical protein
MRFPEPHEIETRRSVLRQKVDEGKRAEQELLVLEEWLNKVDSLFPLTSADPSGGPVFRKPVRGSNPLSLFAEKVLKRFGKLHMDELIIHMREEGWVSTGDNKLDSKNVFNSLSVNNKFVNLGRNVWDLVKEAGKK